MLVVFSYFYKAKVLGFVWKSINDKIRYKKIK